MAVSDRKAEYRQYDDRNKKQPKPNWYMKQALGAIAIVGIGSVAYKMRGPSGKILDKIKDYNLEEHAKRAYEKYARDDFSVLNNVRDLQGKIHISQGKDLPDKIIKTSTTLDATEINMAMARHYGENGLTDASIIKGAQRLETDLESFFSRTKAGSSIDRLRQLDIFKGHMFANAPGQSELARDIMVSKLRLESIKEHSRKRFVYIEGMPEFDASDPIVNEDPFKNGKKIEEYHNFMMENDQIYARNYRATLKNTVKELEMSTKAAAASKPNISFKPVDDVYGSVYQANPKLHSKKFGSTEDLINSASDTTISRMGTGSKLYAAATNKFVSDYIDKYISSKVNTKEMRLKFDRYAPQLKRIASALEGLKSRNPKMIEDVFIQDSVHTISDRVTRSYINIGIQLTGDKKVVIPVPVAKGGVVPNIRGIHRRTRANVNYLTFSPFKVEEASTINSTQLYLAEVERIITSSKMHDLTDPGTDVAKFERDIIRRIGSIQDRETPLTGELRDYFRVNQYRILHHEQMFNSPTGSPRARMDDLKYARNGLRQIKELKRNPDDYMVLALDLETLNIDVPSPQYHPSDSRTRIWQYGMVEMDSKGRIVNVKEVASNHIFNEEGILTNEQVNTGKLREIFEEKTKRGNRLKSFSGYTKKTTKVDDAYESLLAFKNMVDRKSGQSSKYINDTGNPIRNTRDFAELIRREIENFRRKARKAGKKPMIVTANGRKFDLELLASILGDFSIREWADTVDVQSVSRMLTMGYHDAPAMNVSNMLSHYMNKQGLGTGKLISFEHSWKEAIDALSEGKVVRNGLGTAGSLKDMLIRTLGGDNVAAHNSAVLDSVATLGIFNLLKSYHTDTDFHILKEIDDYIQNGQGLDVNAQARMFLALEGMRVDGVSLSFGLMPSNSAANKVLSGKAIAHMFPFLGLNPGNKDLHQVARSLWVRSNSPKKQTSKWRMFNPFQSVNEVRMEEWARKHATDDMNRFANQLQFNTVYTIGKLGGGPGWIGLTDDAIDFTATLTKMVDLSDIPANSQLNNELTQMYRKVLNRAKRLAKMRGESLATGGGEVTAATWAEASKQIRRRMEIHGNAPVIDGNNPITTFIEEGGQRRKIKISLPGKVKSIVQDTISGSDKGTGKFMAEVLFEATGQNLDGILFNHLGTKSLVSKMGVKSADIAAGKFGFLGRAEMFMNWDFLDKKYWGSLKETMVKKAVGLCMWRMDKNNGFTKRERIEATESLKKIVSTMNREIPTSFIPGKGVRFGHGGFGTDPKEIIRSMANITFEDIFKMASTVGHEYTWNRQTLEMYYGLRGGDMNNIWKGRTKVSKEVDMLINHEIKGKAKGIQSIKMSKEQVTLMEHLDPMRLLERKLRADNALRGGSIENHWKMLTDQQKETLLSQHNIPILAQVVPDPTNVQSIGTLGMWAFRQSSTVYGLGMGRENVTNTMVKFQRSYFDQMFIDNNHFSPEFKDMLVKSTGPMKRPKWAHVAKKYDSLRQMLMNFEMSEEQMLKKGLTVEQLESIISRPHTMKAVKRDLEALEAQGEHAALDKIESSLDDVIAATSDISTFEDFEEARKMLDTMTIRDSKDKLKIVEVSDNWIHTKDLEEYSKLAVQNDGVVFLPRKVRKSDGSVIKEYGTSFEFVLEDVIARTQGNSKRDPVNPKSYESLFKRIKNAALEKGFDPNKLPFNIEVDKITGRHKVSMKGFALPLDAYAENLAHHLADGEDYLVKSDGLKMFTDAVTSYKKFSDVVLSGRNEYDKKRYSDNVALAWIKTWAWGMPTDKNSPFFKATSVNYLDGFQATFHSADTIIAEAQDMLENFDSGKNIKLNRWLQKNPSRRGDVKTMLRNVAEMRLDTMMVQSNVLFKGDRVANLADGSSIKLADMFAKSEGEFAKLYKNYKMGRKVMPGGGIFRFPIQAEGAHPGFMANFLAIPEEYRELLGIDKNQIYMSEVLLNAIKADNDNDMVSAIIRGFKTVEEAKDLERQSREGLQKLLTMGKGTTQFLDDFDNANYLAGTYERGGRVYGKIARVDRSKEHFMQLRFDKIPLDQLDYVVKKGDKLGGHFAAFASEEFADYAKLKNVGQAGTDAMKKHINTIALNAYSKNAIGLWSNTMKVRAHEMFQANPGLAKNSTAMFELLGSLKHGIAGMSQQMITFAKHGMASEVYEMGEFLRIMQDPTNADAKGYERLKKWWADKYPEEMREKGEDALDLILNQAHRLNIVRKYDQNAAKFLKHETDNLIGRSSFDFASMAEYWMMEKGLVDDKLSDLAINAADQYYGQAMAKFRGEDVPFRTNQFVSDLLDEGLQNSTRNQLTKRYGNTIARHMPAFKSMGKFAGIGALAYLGLNFFRPNQLSGGAGDAFIDLGTDINNSNVATFGGELELARRMPLDMVNASFSKEAFIEMNNSSITEKKGKSSYINELLKQHVGRNNYKSFQSERRGSTNYISLTQPYGKFNARDYQRRSNLVR